MVKQLIKGEKIIINKIKDPLNRYTLELYFKDCCEMSFDYDVFLFLLETGGSIRKSEVIFYNNPESTKSAVRYTESYEDRLKKNIIDLNLNNFPDSMSKLIVACNVYKGNTNTDKPGEVDVGLVLRDMTSHNEILGFSMKSDPARDNSIIIGEIYVHNDNWKFSAVEYNSGFDLISNIKSFYNAKFI